eukprot:TRINITY_DN9761_c0_g1_i1.p2 TRINITY_DN9761_c0_g1~~TRINITY_DN9761_c0_g1_i1.p2  ORF type:complete len:122 (+),score=17.97 TRINITY_DN9761_c0_g1_i1:108-473(+)
MKTKLCGKIKIKAMNKFRIRADHTHGTSPTVFQSPYSSGEREAEGAVDDALDGNLQRHAAVDGLKVCSRKGIKNVVQAMEDDGGHDGALDENVVVGKTHVEGNKHLKIYICHRESRLEQIE